MECFEIQARASHISGKHATDQAMAPALHTCIHYVHLYGLISPITAFSSLLISLDVIREQILKCEVCQAR